MSRSLGESEICRGTFIQVKKRICFYSPEMELNVESSVADPDPIFGKTDENPEDSHQREKPDKVGYRSPPRRKPQDLHLNMYSNLR